MCVWGGGGGGGGGWGGGEWTNVMFKHTLVNKKGLKTKLFIKDVILSLFEDET